MIKRILEDFFDAIYSKSYWDDFAILGSCLATGDREMFEDLENYMRDNKIKFETYKNHCSKIYMMEVK